MAKRGPKPQSPGLRLVHGNPGKRPLAAGVRGPDAGRPKMPSWLGKIAKAKWRALVPQLEQLGILTVVDGDVIAAYCSAWEEFEAATRVLTADVTRCQECGVNGGRFSSRGTGGLAHHPAVAMQRSAWKAIQSFAAILGLNPSVRRGWLGGDGDDDEADPLDKFLDGDKPA